MSEYINFYIHTRTHDYILLDGYCGSSHVFAYGRDVVPYGTGRYLDQDDFALITRKIQAAIDGAKEHIKGYEEINETILKMNNSVAEKMDLLQSNNASIGDWNEEVEQLTDALHFYSVLWSMSDNVAIHAGIEWYPNQEQENAHYLVEYRDKEKNKAFGGCATVLAVDSLDKACDYAKSLLKNGKNKVVIREGTNFVDVLKLEDGTT